MTDAAQLEAATAPFCVRRPMGRTGYRITPHALSGAPVRCGMPTARPSAARVMRRPWPVRFGLGPSPGALLPVPGGRDGHVAWAPTVGNDAQWVGKNPPPAKAAPLGTPSSFHLLMDSGSSIGRLPEHCASSPVLNTRDRSEAPNEPDSGRRVAGMRRPLLPYLSANRNLS